ncbi:TRANSCRIPTION FACTOR TRIHELIX FAMILY-RELATED [Salix purpurea]|uniref:TRANSCRIPTION FACTOR TRIHELIX FAMILY-RELATED n=1 Tax=Salix purpurea TaxID=77065 RepID=A0A9Q0QEB3_SALPP|nr:TRANSCRIPTION FACTOR TRIHELIX FAMILY-RELATED [Salix purpurea]
MDNSGRAAGPFNGAHYGEGSEDDDRSFMEDGNGENCIGAKDEKGSPRQRMKWTDNVVRVLIAVVDRVGDDSTFDGRQNSFDVGTTATFQDPDVSPWERKEWIEMQRLQLLEQRVNIKAQAFDLENQQFKWSRYCSKKDKEFERSRLLNERTILEIRQSALQLRQNTRKRKLPRDADCKAFGPGAKISGKKCYSSAEGGSNQATFSENSPVYYIQRSCPIFNSNLSYFLHGNPKIIFQILILVEKSFQNMQNSF